MILWLSALVLLAIFAVAGRGQGGIRAAMSFLGIVVGLIAAAPLAPYVKPILPPFGVKNPFVQQYLAPAIVFFVIWVVLQVMSQGIHLKAEIFYKYKAGEKRYLEWERLNNHLGLCVGALNGAAFFVVLLIPIYVFGYLTVQLASGEQDSSGLRIINSARTELQRSKFDRVVAGQAPNQPELYNAFDIVGLVYKNPLLESRLTRYPSFLGLAELPEFQQLANDTQFHNLWQSGATIGDVLKYPKVQTITTNISLINNIRQVLGPDLGDIKQYLETGHSEKYSDTRILGRWHINFNETRNRARTTGLDLKKLNAKLSTLWDSSLVVIPDGRAILKRSERLPGGDNLPKNLSEANWKKEASLYQFTFEGKNSDVVFESDNRIVFTREGITVVFDREM